MNVSRPIALVSAAFFCLVNLHGVAPPAAATEVRFFRGQSREAFLAGELAGVSIDALGRLRLADRVERLTAIEEPFLLAAAEHPEGWVVGTGNAGRVLLVNEQGEARELFAAPEPEVFAVWADGDGTVFAGTSPRGKVYRLAPGGAVEVFFDPGESYIWALARAADGRLLVATGTQGHLYAVDGDGEGELLYDGSDTHLRSLAVLPDGRILIGTAGQGLVLLLDADGAARTLYDAPQPEIVALAGGPGGAFHAAAVASEASMVDLSQPQGEGQGEGDGEDGGGEGEGAVSVSFDAAPPSGTRPGGFAGARGVILRLTPAGLVERLWSFQDETVYSLLWFRGRLWVGTGLEGKLYSYSGTDMVLEKDVEERQIVALLAAEPGPAFATTNAAAFYRATGGTEAGGTYTSPVLDAGQLARFGTLRWQGAVPGRGALRFSFRSGISSDPDATWSPWGEGDGGGGADRGGAEIPLDFLPAGRYLQWRAEFRGRAGASPRLDGVEISYRQQNLQPRIRDLVPLEPGQILVPANFNPANQVYEPAHPNREGIFTTLGEATGYDDGRVKPLWKLGYRALRWAAEDPNQDALTYDLAFRRVPSAAGRGGDEGDEEGEPWLPVASDLEDDFYNFDATVLPDGVYRFRLTASDRASNPPAEALAAERVSEPVIIDHSAPLLAGVERRGGALRVTVEDGGNPLREAVVSADAGPWRAAPSADGLVDGRREVLVLEIPAAARLLLLRLTDAAHNVVTFDLSRHLAE